MHVNFILIVAKSLYHLIIALNISNLSETGKMVGRKTHKKNGNISCCISPFLSVYII